jgi:hypothetical protein
MAVRFNAPVLKTKMAPSRTVASLVKQRTDPNETEALRTKSGQQSGNRKCQDGLLPGCCHFLRFA